MGKLICTFFLTAMKFPKKINDEIKQRLELSTKVKWRNKSYSRF